MAGLSPGYKAPSVLKNGRFYYHARPHEGVHVEGRMARFPAHDPERVLDHFSYDSLADPARGPEYLSRIARAAFQF